jgi:hypothetical protein
MGKKVGYGEGKRERDKDERERDKKRSPDRELLVPPRASSMIITA